MPNDLNNFDGAREPEALPPELEALHHRLLADGALWRRSLPSPEGVIQFARQMTAITGAPSGISGARATCARTRFQRCFRSRHEERRQTKEHRKTADEGRRGQLQATHLLVQGHFQDHILGHRKEDTKQ